MSSWNALYEELRSIGNIHDLVRRRCLQELYQYTSRNVICYYSAFLEKTSRHVKESRDLKSTTR